MNDEYWLNYYVSGSGYKWIYDTTKLVPVDSTFYKDARLFKILCKMQVTENNRDFDQLRVYYCIQPGSMQSAQIVVHFYSHNELLGTKWFRRAQGYLPDGV